MKELLKAENVQILKEATDWKEAIRKSTEPLERGGVGTANLLAMTLKRHL